jgi:PleD family two-component response regulator
MRANAVLELAAGSLASTPTEAGDVLSFELRQGSAGGRGSPMPLKRMLVVEDNEGNRRVLVYRLRKIGRFDIREAANGQQAIEAVKRTRRI